MLAVGCVGLEGVSEEFLVTVGWTDFHFEQSLCEPYRPYRDMRWDEWVQRGLRLGCKMFISGVDLGIWCWLRPSRLQVVVDFGQNRCIMIAFTSLKC